MPPAVATIRPACYSMLQQLYWPKQHVLQLFKTQCLVYDPQFDLYTVFRATCERQCIVNRFSGCVAAQAANCGPRTGHQVARRDSSSSPAARWATVQWWDELSCNRGHDWHLPSRSVDCSSITAVQLTGWTITIHLVGKKTVVRKTMCSSVTSESRSSGVATESEWIETTVTSSRNPNCKDISHPR